MLGLVVLVQFVILLINFFVVDLVLGSNYGLQYLALQAQQVDLLLAGIIGHTTARRPIDPVDKLLQLCHILVGVLHPEKADFLVLGLGEQEGTALVQLLASL